MLSAQAARLCPRAIFRDGDSRAANAKRIEIVHVLLGFTPTVEVSSIDDFFVDLGGTLRLHGSAFDAAECMRSRVLQETRMPVSVGIATNKTMARLAGKLAKPGGVAEIMPGAERAILAHLPVRHLPGVGRSIGRRLEEFHVRTAGELALLSREVLFACFGRPGLVAHARACGIDEEPVEVTHALSLEGELRERAPRSIRRDGTFEPEEGRREQVLAMLAYLVERACARLRGAGSLARTLEVRVEYVDTRPASARRAGSSGSSAEVRWPRQRRSLSEASDTTDELWRHARELFLALPRKRALVKRVGLTLSALEPAVGWQGHLFSDPATDRPGGECLGGARGSRGDRERRLDQAVDALRAQVGFGRLLRGSSLALRETHELGREGFRLRTPSLNQ
jgi:DNA polymerase-4